ncbi:MAG: hypothetical protein HC941_25660 [Microcoleus sp. SU_5_3]|nr:hypothetical protein [Microcoleus sp. SU_5_3]
MLLINVYQNIVKSYRQVFAECSDTMECDRTIRFQTVNIVIALYSPNIGRTCNL